jgi:hypothetical protein
MATDENERERQPVDPPLDEGAGSSAGDADTEGHSMLTLELGRTMERDRVRDTEKASRAHARAREIGVKRDGGLFRRFRRP